MTIAVICDIIILIGAVLVAITTIYNFFRKAGKGVKDRVDEVKQAQEDEFNQRIDGRLKEVLPCILTAHDLETRDRYRADRERYLEEISNDVVETISEQLRSVENHEAQMLTFNEVLKELLRERIMVIFGRNKGRRQLEEHEKVELTRAYTLYKAIGGNSYIDDYYARMQTWEIIPDDGKND